MIKQGHRAYIVIGILLASYLIAFSSDAQFSNREINIGGKSYELLSVRQSERQIGVVREGNIFRYSSKQPKFQVKVGFGSDQKWIDVDHSTYLAASNKLRAIGY